MTVKGSLWDRDEHSPYATESLCDSYRVGTSPIHFFGALPPAMTWCPCRPACRRQGEKRPPETDRSRRDGHRETQNESPPGLFLKLRLAGLRGMSRDVF